MLVECPHCEVLIEILEVNCGIFRCGIFKVNGEQVPPHLPKDACDDLKDKNHIWGCCRPFQYVDGKVKPCDYL